MNRIRRPLSLLLCAAFTFSQPSVAAAAELKPASPAELLKVWKDYGLPLPPTDAPLVKFTTGVRDGDSEAPYYAIGFLLRPSAKESPAVILSGWSEFRQSGSRDDIVEKIEPSAASLKGIKVVAELGLVGPNALLGTAIQCEARGWTEFARTLLVDALGQSAGHHFSTEAQPAGMPGLDAVHVAVWQYLRTQAMHPGADRAPIATKMKRLLDSGHDLPREGGKWLHEATLAAAQPGKGKPGTPEALIDRLIDSQQGGGIMSASRDVGADDPYYQVEALGFAVIPALLEHLEDPRLTCSMTTGFNNFPEWPRRIGDLAGDLLQDLAGDELGADWLDRQKGGGPALKAAQAWWEKAKAVGEEVFLVKHAMAPANSDRSFPNACHLRILKSRYPQRLAEVMRTQMKKHPMAQLHPVLTAIEESKLPSAEKTVLFREAAQHTNPETRRNGLSHISKLDPAWFHAETVKAFDAMKAKTPGPYWTAPEAHLSHLALLTDDDAVWAAFLRAAQRADTGLRMELMNPFNYTYVGGSFRLQRLRFLRALLDDTTLREMPTDHEKREKSKYTGPCAAFTIPRLRVCDFAAMQAASILKWPDRPDEKWAEKQWEDLRARVKQAPEMNGK